MKLIAITIPKLEQVTVDEISEILKLKSTAYDSVVEFESDNFSQIAKFCYMTRSSSRVLLLLDKQKITEIDKLKFPKIPLQDEFKTFRIRCTRIGEHNFNSHDIEKKLGEKIIDNYRLEVNISSPDITFFSYIYNENIYLGIDICGFDLSKRDYKIINNPYSIKGNLAFAMVKLSGFKPGETLLDTFIRAGEIVIEAASYSSATSIHNFRKDEYFFTHFIDFKDINLDKFESDGKSSKIFAYADNQKYISASKKNAKIQGINKFITFSKTDIDWIDTKFEKSTINRVVTILSKTRLDKKFEKTLDDFFHQMRFVLKKDGKVVVLTKTPELFDAIKDFKVEKIKMDTNIILIFSKNI